MVKLYKDFFKDNDVLFVGYSSRNSGYSKLIYKAFTDNRIKVYPLNTKDHAAYDVKVYKSLEELPMIPKSVFILLSNEHTKTAVKDLLGKGVERILFRQKTVDPAIIAECEKEGIETAYGCPMMIYGTGLHKLHAVFAGVK